MKGHAVMRVLGVLLTVFSFTQIPPMLVGLWYGDGAVLPFLIAFGLTLGLGLLIWLPTRKQRSELRLRDGFLVVAMFWAVLGLFGALPFVLAEWPQVDFTDSVFESISGLTTTGATVISGLDDLPHSILFYRQQLQWLGGMGIIVLAVAILPMLGIGGMQLYRAETPGPVKDQKLTPRITETAKAMWYLYLSLTTVCALLYFLAGMTPFDAIGHAFSTIATGGFSTHDASIGYFDSNLIILIADVFMFISAVNFSLHFLAWRSGRGIHFRHYWADAEFRVYTILLASLAVITVVYLQLNKTFSGWDALSHGVFQAISIATGTGFTTAEYFSWPGFLPVLLLFASFIGACAGSTGGGMKVMRAMLLYKQGKREINRLIHPNAQFPVKVGGKPVPEKVINAVWGFFALYVASFTVMMLFLMATGLDQITAFSAVAACMNNLGPGLGDVGVNYADLNSPSKWVLSFAMLLGRLEIFTLLVLLTPAFWRQ